MKAPGCERISLSDLTDYAAGELPDAEAAAIEEHLFSRVDCGARTAEFDALVAAIRPAIRSGEVGGFVTDDVLNRLAREGCACGHSRCRPVPACPAQSGKTMS